MFSQRLLFCLVAGLAGFSNATSSFSSGCKSVGSTPRTPAHSHTRSESSHHGKTSHFATHSTKTRSHSASHASRSRTHSRSASAACTATTITTLIASSTPPAGTSTVTDVSTVLINGDDGLLTCGATSTYYESYVYETTVYESVTYTQTTTSSSIIPPDATETVPAPRGFVPVQDTLPNAVYIDCEGGLNPIDNSCQTPNANTPQRRDARKKSGCTSTITSTQVLPASTITITITTTTTLLVFPNEQSTYDYKSCTTYYADGGTATRQVTTETDTFYAITTESITTQPVTTTTLYPACAPSNFADAIDPYTDGKYHRLSYVDTDRYPDASYTTSTTYDCCVLAFQAIDIAVWYYYPQGTGFGGICLLLNVSNNGTCGAQTADTYGVEVFSGNGTLPTIVGNAACGEYNRVGASV